MNELNNYIGKKMKVIKRDHDLDSYLEKGMIVTVHSPFTNYDFESCVNVIPEGWKYPQIQIININQLEEI